MSGSGNSLTSKSFFLCFLFLPSVWGSVIISSSISYSGPQSGEGWCSGPHSRLCVSLCSASECLAELSECRRSLAESPAADLSCADNSLIWSLQSVQHDTADSIPLQKHFNIIISNTTAPITTKTAIIVFTGSICIPTSYSGVGITKSVFKNKFLYNTPWHIPCKRLLG